MNISRDRINDDYLASCNRTLRSWVYSYAGSQMYPVNMLAWALACESLASELRAKAAQHGQTLPD